MKPFGLHQVAACGSITASTFSALYSGLVSPSVKAFSWGLFTASALAFAGGFAVTTAQAESTVETVSNKIDETAENHESYGFKAGSFVVAPIPFRNPTIGAGLALGGGYLFKFDDTSKTSHIALGGMRSENGTNGFGLAGALAWDNNRWQLNATLAKAEAFYDLYVAGTPIPIRQEGSLFNGSLLYGVTPQLSFGPEFRYLDTTAGLEGSGGIPPWLLPDSDLTLASFGLVARYDTRDDSLYPRSGVYLDTSLLGNWTVEGAAREYVNGFANFALYKSLSNKTVFASQISICGSSSDTPYFDQCAIGKQDAFRGFSTTQYYDLSSLSLQVELRQKIAARFGLVAFAGAGMTGPDFAALQDDGIHAAAGVGVRFQLTKKFETDFSVDASYNDEDEAIVYIYVGQRF